MTDSEIGFDIEMKQKVRELQLNINQLITDFEQKYFNKGVRVEVAVTDNTYMLKEGGKLKLIISTRNSLPVIDRLKTNVIDARR